jgi:hypothetical protein
MLATMIDGITRVSATRRQLGGCTFEAVAAVLPSH